MNPNQVEIYDKSDPFRFKLSGVNVSIANALRRIILSEIPRNVIKTEIYKDNQCFIDVNTTQHHNEIIKQRLSCIPIHMKKLEILPNNYILEVDVKNDTDEPIYVTTEHFKLRNKLTKEFMEETEKRKIFPPDILTNSYIDFVKLRPKISETIPGEHIKLKAEISISNARENSMFNVVTKCSYGYTRDTERIKETIDTMKQTMIDKGAEKEEIEFAIRNFRLLDEERIFIPDSFDFVIQSNGIYENQEVVVLGAKRLVDKFATMVDLIDASSVEILNSETTVDFSFDILLQNEDYTIGKVLEFIMYSKYYEGEKTLSFCGFKKFHPHDTTSTIRIAFEQRADKNMAKEYLRTACVTAQEIFTKIGKMF
jgi:DNA-directed RNA polymerase alpha subunit